MPSVDLAALAAGSLLGLAPLAVAAGRWRQVSGFIYGASGALCAVVMLTGLLALIGNGPDTALKLPLGLPWLGVHLRLDALSAFFLVVLGIGGGMTKFMRSATAGMSTSRSGYCRSIRRSSARWRWCCWLTTRSPS